MCPSFFLKTEEWVSIFYLADDKGIEDDCVLHSLGVGLMIQMKDTYSTEIED